MPGTSPQISKDLTPILEFFLDFRISQEIDDEMPDGICKDMAGTDLTLFLFLRFLYKKIRLKQV